MAKDRGRTASWLRLAPGMGLLVLVLALAGCEAVWENRTIEFSPEANAVGFQHGEQGVFVADRGRGGLKKVFQPDVDVLATSTPQCRRNRVRREEWDEILSGVEPGAGIPTCLRIRRETQP